MKQKKILIILIIIMGILSLSSCTKNSPAISQKHNNIEATQLEKEIPPPGTSFSEYYKTSSLYFYNRSKKTPEELGLKIIRKINVGCFPNENDPCGRNIFIISKTEIQEGNQDFFLAQENGSDYGDDYTYYGPFFDNLERVVNESKEAKKTW